MIEFRDRYTAELGVKLIVHKNRSALDNGANPFEWGTQRCCGALKTTALLDGLRNGGFDAAIGGRQAR
jgi:sulfate adenylyltransferase subunit 2